MRRFFFDPMSRSGDSIFLTEEESRHVAKVLRLSVGSEIQLLDGQGAVYQAVIVSAGRRVEARIIGVVEKKQDAEKEVWVAQGILKGEKMDTIVQKCTELGVTRFTPLQTSRCQGRADAVQNHKRHERWQRIGLAACKQCRRSQLMRIDAPVDLADLLQGVATTHRLLFWEEEKDIYLQDIPFLPEAQSVTILLGPEGGLSHLEIDQARQYGWSTVSLGGRILRAETATLTAVSIVQFLIGNL